MSAPPPSILKANIVYYLSPKCDLQKDEDSGFIDHMCTTAEDLEPINCKRSKYETSVSNNWLILIRFILRDLQDPGRRETCVGYNNLISCEAGHCKNISKIWDCTYKDRYVFPQSINLFQISLRLDILQTCTHQSSHVVHKGIFSLKHFDESFHLA